MPQEIGGSLPKFELPVLHCKVCEHDWSPRKATPPKWCPNCGSEHWQTGRRRPPIAEQRALAEKKREALDFLNQMSEADAREAVLAVLAVLDGKGLVLQLDNEERDLLTARAKEMGHSNPAHFAEDLIRIGIGKPVEEVQEFMGVAAMLRRAHEAVTGRKKKAA